MATALTAGNLTNLRAGNHTSKAWLAVFAPTTVGTAQINQTSFTNPIAQLTIDSKSANFTTLVKAGMTVWLGTTAGARDVGVFRVRKAPTSTILYINEISDGDSGGLSLATLAELADNLHITVLNHYGIHPVLSRIAFSGGTGTFYKDYDIAYANQTTVTSTPVQINIGDHFAGFVDTSTNKVTVSYAVVVRAFGSGVTASSYSWNVDDGTITVGSGSSSSITATFPKGQRWVTCAVTLSNSVMVTVKRAVMAYNTSDTLPYEIEITSDTRTLKGRTVNFNVTEKTLDNANLNEGTLGIIFEQSSWNGGTIGTAITQFTGYVRTAATNSSATQAVRGDYVMESALLLYEQMPFVSQQLTVASTPANWAEVSTTLAHTEYYMFYLLYWHSTLSTLFDLFPDGTYIGYKFQAFSSAGGSLLKALDENLARLNMGIGQSSAGSLYVYRNPAYMTNAERNALAERMTITDDDISQLDFEENLRAQVSLVKGYGASYSNGVVTPYVSQGMGLSRGEGGIEETLEGQLLSASGAQAELNRRTSNHFVMLSNPHPRITALFIGNYDVFDLPNLAWVSFSISQAYSPNGVAYSGRAYPVEVSVAWLPDGVKIATGVFTEETSGLNAPAQTMPVVIGNDYPPYEIPFPPIDPDTGGIVIPYDPYVPPIDIFGDGSPIENPPEDDPPSGARIVFAWGGGTLAYMYPDLDAQWMVLHTLDDVDGYIVDVMIDKQSTIFTNPDGDLTLWVTTDDAGSEEGILKITDTLTGSPTVVRKDTASYYLRQNYHEVGGITGQEYGPTDEGYFGDSSTRTCTLPGNSAATQNISLGNSTFSKAILTSEGTIQYGAAGYEVDAAYFTTDGWTTYERHNGIQVNGMFIRPSKIAYNTNHHYIWNFKHIDGETLVCAYISPDGTYTGSGSIVLKVFVSSSTSLYGSGTALYTDDEFTTENLTSNTTLLSTTPPDYGFDVNDYSYLIAQAQLDEIHYSTTSAFDGITLTRAQDMAVYDEMWAIHLLKIPYRTIASGRNPNSNLASCHFVYGRRTASGSLRKAVYNFTGDVVVSDTDITPVISSVNYICLESDSLEISGNDSRVMAGWFEKETGQDGSVVLYTSTGGTSWTARTLLAGGDFLIWETKSAFWTCGTDHNDVDGAPICYSPDRGVTVYDYTTNWDDVVGERPIEGCRVARF